jgi:hypothetical protein
VNAKLDLLLAIYITSICGSRIDGQQNFFHFFLKLFGGYFTLPITFIINAW